MSNKPVLIPWLRCGYCWQIKSIAIYTNKTHPTILV
ncbi:hypothetical protein BN1007_71135 [Klebsiella variicola]|nr:hypothetical protein BN1007_71135 [Klebsiella variicola]